MQPSICLGLITAPGASGQHASLIGKRVIRLRREEFVKALTRSVNAAG